MVACIIAFVVFAVLSLFSAKHRPLAKEAFKCVFLKMTLRPCESGLDQKIKAKVVSRVFDHHPGTAKFVNVHFEGLSFVFMILMLASTIIVAQGAYNIYLYGTCDPVHPEQCIVSGVVKPQAECPDSAHPYDAEHGLMSPINGTA